MTIAYVASTWVLPVLIAVTLHEAAHGWVAMKLGDPTAKQMGRVSFNPIKHVDPVGTIVLPALMLLASGGKAMFGFAKPVPVNFAKLRHPRRDMILVAAAGPGINIALAVAAAITFRVVEFVVGDAAAWVYMNLANAIWINILLAIFNMLPIPPLDGGRVAVGLLPWSIARHLARLERFGLFIVLGVIFFLPWIGSMFGVNLNLFWLLVIEPAVFIQDVIAALVGI